MWKATGDSTIQSKLVDMTRSTGDASVCVLAVCVCVDRQCLIEAYELASENHSIELTAIRVQLLMMLGRYSEAEKLYIEMKDKDSVLTRMTGTLIDISNRRYQDNYLSYCDFQTCYRCGEDAASDKNKSLVTILGKGISNLNLMESTEALEEFNAAKSIMPTNEDVLANFVTTYAHMHNQDKMENALNELAKHHPQHQYVQKKCDLDSSFKRFTQSLSV
eukprot:GHVR01137371.1.p1 GENE.GHVR01137371.1~~GHVR01137371.1.p1  ORF type:complete len:219 (+),score=34.64 GHVR01137371.1:269-925(+)